MTLNDILVASLAQLDRGHDAQTLDTWRDKLTLFVNDAVKDIAAAIPQKRREKVKLIGGRIQTESLSRECLRVYRVIINGADVEFTDGEETGAVYIENAQRLSVNDVEVLYAFAPRTLTSPTDVPELPEICHGLIVCYVVGRERASGDVSTQSGSNPYMRLYENGKSALRQRAGGQNRFRIVNRW